MFRIGVHVFEETGEQLRMDIRLVQYTLDPDPLYEVSDVDSDMKRRHDGGRVICRIQEELSLVRTGKNNDPFSTGTASDEILAQAREVLEGMITLRILLEGTHA